jgi:hypothetical protein
MGEAAVSLAWAFFVVNRMSRQGMGKSFAAPTTRLRRGMNEHVSAWLTAVDGLPEFHERLRRVQISKAPALRMLSEYDSPETLFYLDPPYMPKTRSQPKAYSHEMTEQQHARLLCRLAMPTVIARTELEAYLWKNWRLFSGKESYTSVMDEFEVDFHGKFLLSGYNTELYQKFAELCGWEFTVMERPNAASAAKTKEVKQAYLWRNYTIPEPQFPVVQI